ncbi:hypothetical protein D9M71_796550 [compost metagenome]
MSYAANEVHQGPATARVIRLFRRPGDLDGAQAKGRQVLELVNTHLAERDWLVGGQPSIADVAIYPYLAMAEEGGLSLAPYPHLQAWFARIRALPGYLELPRL